MVCNIELKCEALKKRSALADELLFLKRGFPVMLLRSVKQHKDDDKSALYIVKAIHPNLLFFELRTSDNV